MEKRLWEGMRWNGIQEEEEEEEEEEEGELI